MTTHSNGMSALQLEAQLGVTYKTAWLLTQKLRRSMIDPNRELLEGVIEVDQTEIPFRVGDAFFEPGNAGKILIAGAIEVIERDTSKPKPRRKGAKYLDTRSGRLRLAVIADNSAASLETFVRANVKPGATLITDGHASYPGLAGDYRHDPRVVGMMAANIVLPWSHRAFALMKRWALGTYHGLRRKHVDGIRVSLQSQILPARLLRNHARPRRQPRAGELSGHHRARKAEQKSDRRRRPATTCR